MNIFNYESKFNQVLMTVADVIILNLLYIVCCLPIFTIGAAQAGLFTGIRVLLDKDDDSSCAKAFFRGFSGGFGKVTFVSTLLLAIVATLLYVLLNTLYLLYNADGSVIPVALCALGVCIAYIIHCLVGPFHATFDCTPFQLLRNCLFLAFAYPVRSLLVAVLVVLPLAVFMLGMNVFLGAIPAILAIYYSVAYLLCFSLLKKPFGRLKESFYDAHPDQRPVDEEEMEEEATEED